MWNGHTPLQFLLIWTQLYLDVELCYNWCRNLNGTSPSGPLLGVIGPLICDWCRCSHIISSSTLEQKTVGLVFSFFPPFSVIPHATHAHVMSSCKWDQHFSHHSSLPCLSVQAPLRLHVGLMVFSWEILPSDVSGCGRTLQLASWPSTSVTEWICLIV